ncbi:3'-5' exoribonuclease [Agrobacterium tumefaciens]|uniref:3'-5' exoribonuclease n=1 Tax=Agrobacterium tumefaciens TaxID=358 RepID=UPI001574A4CB|nr:3'-5' exoribonuclease [Agrobacterium tumefaciens]NSX94050.1 3'-5' exoribonuclease [Agrobacterium tumefaciens]
MQKRTSYIVTDIEADGPDPGINSMLSIASVAKSETGDDQGEFSVNIIPLEEGVQDPATMLWWMEQPTAWADATNNPQPPGIAIGSWAKWVRSLPGTPVFVAHPLSFDGSWVDWYLQRFLEVRLFDRAGRPGFTRGAGIDIPSLVMAQKGWDYYHCSRNHYPDEWLGGHAHNHCAIDDARGYAHLLALIVKNEII